MTIAERREAVRVDDARELDIVIAEDIGARDWRGGELEQDARQPWRARIRGGSGGDERYFYKIETSLSMRPSTPRGNDRFILWQPAFPSSPLSLRKRPARFVLILEV